MYITSVLRLFHCSSVQYAVLLGLAGIGLLCAASATASGLTFLWRQFMRPARQLSAYGKWAIVTGASHGIGREYCNYLAKQGGHKPCNVTISAKRLSHLTTSVHTGMNIYLVSRTESKLEAAAAEIAKDFDVDTKYYAIDLAEAAAQPLDGPFWTEFKMSISDMDVGVLINNAGKTQGDPSHLHVIEPASIDSTIALNDTALVKMTHSVLPGMVRRGRGAIINISSVMSAMIPAAPLVSLYAASKGFVDTFSKSLAAEYASKGISVQVQAPGPVNTGMVRCQSNADAMSPEPATYVRYAGRHIGYEPLAIPYPMHAFTMFLAKALPRRVIAACAANAMLKLKDQLVMYDAAQKETAS